MSNENRVAPEGKIWVCCACGKTASNRYGGPGSSRGWDESCALNSQLFDKEKLVFSGTRVVEVKNDTGTT